MVDFTQWTPQPGIARGAAEFASGLTSPETVMVAAATDGLGSIAKQLGKPLVGRMIPLGFSADMLHGAYQQIPELREAWNKSDWPRVRQQLTRMALDGTMAAIAGAHAVKGEGVAGARQAETPAPPEQEYTSTGEAVRAAGDIFDRVEEKTNETGRQEEKPTATEGVVAGGAAAGTAGGEPAAHAADAGAGADHPLCSLCSIVKPLRSSARYPAPSPEESL